MPSGDGDDCAWPSIFHYVDERTRASKTSSLCDTANHSVTMVELPKKASLLRCACEKATEQMWTLHASHGVWSEVYALKIRMCEEQEREREKKMIDYLFCFPRIQHTQIWTNHKFIVCSCSSFFIKFLRSLAPQTQMNGSQIFRETFLKITSNNRLVY